MIRTTARQLISIRHRGWSSNNIIGKSISGYASSSLQNNNDVNNTNFIYSKRLMSGSSSTDNNGSSFTHQDSTTTMDIPSFGSSPISPQNNNIDISDATTTAIAQEIAAFEPTWWPSDQALLLINWVNENAGLPCYAYAIGATTLAFRVVLFPLFVKGQANSSRMAHMQPELKLLKDDLERLGDKIDQQTQMRHIAQTRALFKKYDCNPLKSIIAPLLSMPIFMSMFFGLKKAPELFPDLLSTGGMLWFPDLTVADPYMALPILSAATFLGMTEMGKEQMMASDPARGRTMVNVFRGLAVIMVPITMNFNTGVFVYWTVNNTFSFVQAALLKQPAVKKAFGIWDPPKALPGTEGGPLTIDDMMNKIKEWKEGGKKEEPNAWDGDRVKQHNEIIAQQKAVVKKLKEKEGLMAKTGRKRRSGGRK